MTINLHDESPIRRCRKHSVYFVKGDRTHEECDSYPLTWSEVVYYLDKLDSVQSTVGELRRLLHL